MRSSTNGIQPIPDSATTNCRPGWRSSTPEKISRLTGSAMSRHDMVKNISAMPVLDPADERIGCGRTELCQPVVVGADGGGAQLRVGDGADAAAAAETPERAGIQDLGGESIG